MAFTANATGTVAIDDSLILLYNEGIIFAAAPALVADQVANVRTSINGKSETFTKYANLAVSTTALVELDDAVSVALVDSSVTITPVEQGAVVTKTRLAELQSGGRVNTAVMYLVGQNMGATKDKLAINALEAGSGATVLVSDVAEASMAATNVMDKTLVHRGYNKLSRTDIPKFNGYYFGIAHDDVLHDLKESASAGSWNDVNKYSNVMPILQNEIGEFGGIRWLKSSQGYINTDGGATTVDTYHTYICGFNALGKVESSAGGITINPAGDKLGRFTNVGWLWTGAYGVVDASSYIKLVCASSVGSNT